MQWLKNAFAIESAERFEPTETERDLVDRLCRQIIGRELTTPALLFLESARPLNFLTAQTMQFFIPLLSLLGNTKACDEFAAFLERRGSIEFLTRRLEELAAAPPVENPET